MRDARDEELIRLLDDAQPREPRVPRERMWEVIQERLDGSRAAASGAASGAAAGAASKPASGAASRAAARAASRAASRKGWLGSSGARRFQAPGLFAAGIVLLAAGIGIGRWTAAAAPGLSWALPGALSGPRSGEGTAAAAGSSAMSDPGPAMASTLAHLSEVDVLLELFQESGREAWARQTAVHWAEALLQETRVLIDLHRRADPGLAQLLQDLELVLVQVARLEEAGRDGAQWEGEEIRLISEALQEGSLRPRIRGFIPLEANSQ